ncbi:hypothetical protein [Shewanella waksmanii]|uniref:hypothetical protein n=1 Tax=Shewanella waksmanii TaxID=213783 RepID=UPI00048AA7BE|nr:hypothetical protein [Shewanella waksmanii]
MSFKKTTLALALASVCSAAIATPTVTVPNSTFSKQGLEQKAGTVEGATVEIKHGAALQVGDRMLVEISGNTTVTWPITVDMLSGDDTSVTDPATDASATGVWGLLDSDGATATYRLTNLETAGDVLNTVNSVTKFAGYDVDVVDILASGVNFSVDFKLADGTNVDGDKVTKPVASSQDQFGGSTIAGVDKANEVVDIEAERKTFVGGSTQDVVTITAAAELTPAGGWGKQNQLPTTEEEVATVKNQVFTLKGDFTSTTVTANGVTITPVDGKAVYTYVTGSDAGSAIGDLTTTAQFVITPTGAAALKAPQSFTADVVYEYYNTVIAGSALTGGIASSDTPLGMFDAGTNLDAGEWTLNGSIVHVPYMPYGPGISQIVYVDNKGTQDGSIFVDWYDEDGMSGTCDLTTDYGVAATAGTVTKFTAELKSCILGDATSEAKNKVAFTVTVNSPEDDITVYSAYNVNGSDRGMVNNSQYKGVK